MTGQIFNLQADGQLIGMDEAPFVNEDLFQELLERYPNLLAGDQINSSEPRRWLLIRREMGIPSESLGADRWSLDHLFLDQDAIPTLVEVKRSSDTRIRREVVGQVLDYAANAVVHWSIEQVVSAFEQQCQSDGIDPAERLAEFLGDGIEPEDFWKTAKTNLQAGRIRMLFVADIIPPELRRIVEFLNAQMDPAEVLAVEIRHFVGQGLKTLVPRVIGQTAEAESRKGGTSVRKAPLTEAELQALAEAHGVGALYASLVRELRPLFPKTATTASNVAFNGKVSGVKSAGTLISLFPANSSAEQGVRFAMHIDRLVEFFQVEKDALVETLPACDKVEQNPGWSGEYREGFAPPATGLRDLIQLLTTAKQRSPN